MEEAEALTARSIGEPYKSEHNIGLAVDFNDVNYAFENEKSIYMAYGKCRKLWLYIKISSR